MDLEERLAQIADNIEATNARIDALHDLIVGTADIAIGGAPLAISIRSTLKACLWVGTNDQRPAAYLNELREIQRDVTDQPTADDDDEDQYGAGSHTPHGSGP